MGELVPAQLTIRGTSSSSAAENFDVDRDDVTGANDLCPNSVSWKGVNAWGWANVTGTGSAALVVFKVL